MRKRRFGMFSYFSEGVGGLGSVYIGGAVAVHSRWRATTFFTLHFTLLINTFSFRSLRFFFRSTMRSLRPSTKPVNNGGIYCLCVIPRETRHSTTTAVDRTLVTVTIRVSLCYHAPS